MAAKIKGNDGRIFVPKSMNDIDHSFFKANGYKFKKVIGKGSFGVIFLVFSSHYNQLFAIKRVRESEFKTSEIDCIKMLDHPNIVQLFNYFFFKNNVYLVMEYCQCNLQDIMKIKGCISDETFVKHAHSILKAIKACHDHQIAHKDIKPTNFLIDTHGRVKVCDFGLSQKITDNELMTHCSGSFMFMAPEMLARNPHDPFKADVWALGVTFYFLAVGKYPWKFDSTEKLLRRIRVKGLSHIPETVNSNFVALIRRCLKVIPDERPTVDELLKEQIFVEYENQMKGPPKRRARSLSFNNKLNVVPLIVRPSIHPSVKALCPPILSFVTN